MELKAGLLVRQYRLMEKLGSGGMGEIYKAQDTRLNRFVAIKVLPPSQSGNREMQRRFIQEAQSASALNHPNIITIYDIIQDGDAQYIVMEYVAGETLQNLIPAGGLPVPQVLRYAAQMADALSVAHAAGIIHRDLKPANVMVTKSELVKLLDFGLAKWTGQSSPLGAPQAATATVTLGAYSADQATLTESPLTVEGSILGTLNYMSPEQAEGKRVDARADIFSFGAVLYEMTTGRRAFEGDSTVAILSAVLRDEVAPLAVAAPEAPRELDHIIGQCLRKDQNARWQSMREVELELTALRRKSDSGILYQAKTVVSSPVASPSRAAARPSRRPVIYASVGIALLAVIGVAGWWWNSHRQTTHPPSAAVAVPAPVAPAPTPVAAPTPNSPNSTPAPVITARVPPAINNAPPNPSQISPFNKATAPLAATPPQPSPAAPATANAPAPAANAPSAAIASKVAPENKSAQLMSVKLNDALPFRIVLADDVPADTAEGQSVSFRVADGLQVGDSTVIAKGAIVTGEVMGEVGKKKFFGIGGGSKLSFRLLYAESVENEKIRVRAISAMKADSAPMRPFETSKASRSKEVVAQRGTEYIAYIDGEQTVSVHKLSH